MNRMFRLAWVPLVLWVLAAPAVAGPAPEGPDSARDYWKTQFPQISPSDLEYQKTMAVFQRVLAAADKKKGIEPELILIDEQGSPWAKSIPDGGIILTRGAIRICYQDGNKELGDARMAFVLGHEISHQVNGDFWHYFFYQGLHPERVRDDRSKQILEGVISIAKQTDSIEAKELAADQYGILYASQAGYNVKGLVASRDNFFHLWAASTNPKLVEGVEISPDHPDIELRTATVMISVRKVLEALPNFERGIQEYDNKHYLGAIGYFERFIQVYQSREVYNNLGLCHFKLAGEALSQWDPARIPPFKLSLTVDRVTRATETLRTAREGTGYFANTAPDPKGKFNRHIEKAVTYLTEASIRDPYYPIARNNLGNVYILTGKYTKAVGEFEEALTLDRNSPQTLNNLGVGLLLLGADLGTDLQAKAVENFLSAVRIDPKYKDPYYNLAIYYQQVAKMEDAKKYAEKYLALDPSSPDAMTLRRTLLIR